MSTSPSDHMLSEQDWETLSAYLDRQLSPAEQQVVEQRLRIEPAMREAFIDLQSTVNILQETKALVPPRSFTIDPVKAKRSFFAMRFLAQFSGIAAAMVIVFGVALGALAFSVYGVSQGLMSSTGGGFANTSSAPAFMAKGSPQPTLEMLPMAAGTTREALPESDMTGTNGMSPAVQQPGTPAMPLQPADTAIYPPPVGNLLPGGISDPSTVNPQRAVLESPPWWQIWGPVLLCAGLGIALIAAWWFLQRSAR